ncbi:RNA recognition motif-containing protein [Dispira parvispora]|uniref:RNA recognition motif-containing protein n=1 Tax=Dispira parvispora TaxID=1520584 RepID=A0A9W8AQE0_9FUNG|nr:RNA recognition motif-containing protein [Dispira parvispora]
MGKANRTATTVADDDALHSKTTLFVRGIPRDATSADLEAFFSEIGPLRSCFVVTEQQRRTDKPNQDDDDATGPLIKLTDEGNHHLDEKPANKGYGFVRFALEEDVVTALKELPEKKFMDKVGLKMEPAIRRTRSTGADKSGGRSRDNKGKKEEIEKVETKDVKEKEEVGPPFTKVVVTGLSQDVTKKQLYKKVRKLGHVVQLDYPYTSKVPSQETTGQSALVQYASANMARQAMKGLQNHVFKGCQLQAEPLMGEQGFEVNPEARLVVRNLPFSYDSPEILPYFSKYGTVEEVILLTKGKGERSSLGVAFVQMASAEEAQKAMEGLDGSDMEGRNVVVEWARLPGTEPEEPEPKAERKASKTHSPKVDAEEVAEESSEEVDNPSEADSNTDKDSSADEVASSSGSDTGSDSEESASVDGDAQPSKPETRKTRTPAKGATLFIRNLSFETTDEALHERFSQLGKLAYAIITRSSTTGLSQGTGFVCFTDPKVAQSCVEMSAKVQENIQHEQTADGVSKKDKPHLPGSYHSVLVPEAPKSLQGVDFFTLDQRLLSVVPAVSREEAQQLKESNKNKKSGDQRNLYLLQEGAVPEGSDLALALGGAAMAKRQESYQERKKSLAKNPNLFLSKVRITVRGLPKSVDDASLRQMCLDAFSSFKSEVEGGIRQDLTPTEKYDGGWDGPVKVKQAKMVREKDRVDAKTQKLMSKGFGFVEFTQHAHALAVLRYLNNNPEVFGPKQRPQVEFAIENARILHKRELRTKFRKAKSTEVTPTEASQSTKGVAARFHSGAGAKGNKRKAATGPNPKPTDPSSSTKSQTTAPAAKRVKKTPPKARNAPKSSTQSSKGNVFSLTKDLVKQSLKAAQ